MSRLASVQAAYLCLESIQENTLCLSGGQYRAVLEVGSVNFGLQGEVEQEATIAGFAAFLNSLSLPVQILVRALPIDLEAYLGELERRALRSPEELADLARDHVAFLRRLARTRTLLERRFYLVIPAQEGSRATAPSWSWPFARRVPDLGAGSAHKQLDSRCEEASRQLARFGLTAQRLSSTQLAQLLYDCWCPELARVQRVRRDLAEYTTLVVKGPGEGPRSDGRAVSRRWGRSTQSSVLSPQHSTRRP